MLYDTGHRRVIDGWVEANGLGAAIQERDASAAGLLTVSSGRLKHGAASGRASAVNSLIWESISL